MRTLVVIALMVLFASVLETMPGGHVLAALIWALLWWVGCVFLVLIAAYVALVLWMAFMPAKSIGQQTQREVWRLNIETVFLAFLARY